MKQNMDLISTVDIDISAPLPEQGSYDKLLIVGPLPAVAPSTPPAQVGYYTSLDEVTAAGWVTVGAGADPVGIAARVAFSQANPPIGIYIAPTQTSEGENNTVVTEAAVDTVKRAMNTDGWYVICTAGVPTAQYEAIAQYVDTTEKLFCYTELASIGENAITPTVAGTHTRAIAIFGKETGTQVEGSVPAVNKYMNVAFMTVLLRYDSGTETAAFKTLSTVNPSSLSVTEVNKLVAANINYFIPVGGRNITMNGKTLYGEWIDVIRFRDWLKNDMQVRVVNLFVLNPKITLDDAGITLIQNQMLASLKAGQDRGGIAADEFDSDGNLIPSYTVETPMASSLTDMEKASRSLSNFTFTAKIKGAIHFAQIKGNLVYTM